MFNVFHNQPPVATTMTLYGAADARFNHIRFTGLVFMVLGIAAWLFCAPAHAQGVPEIDDETYIIMAYGDSLMAGHGIPKELAFPTQLEHALKEKGYNVHVRNDARSGDTTFSGSKRLAWSLQKEPVPDLVILGLGANDALRGMKPKHTRTNLAKVVYDIRSQEIDVLLLGMKAPPNMGPAYGAQFNGIFTQLSQYYSVPLYPFILEGVAGKPSLNNEDGVHPNPEGVAVMVQNILPHVEKMLPDYVYVDPSLPPRDPAAYGGLDED